MNSKIAKELAPLFSPEFEDSYNYLSLSANENVISDTAAQFLGSKLANRYYFKATNGRFLDFPDFAASGLQTVDGVVNAAKDVICEMAGASYVNLFALSGIHAMLMSIVSLTEPGDTVLSLSPAEGGHFSTRSIVEKVGRSSIVAPLTDGKIDIDKLSDLLKDTPVKLIYLDLMNHIETVDIASIRAAARPDTYIVYDASHTLGLILGGQFQDPFAEGADVICANTHKTFPGPHRGLILAKDTVLGEKIESTIDGTFYSSVHYGTLLAMLVTIFEMHAYGKEFAKQIIKNANTLAQQLEASSVKVAHSSDGSYTKNHQIHLSFRNRGEARSALELLRENDIVAHLCFRKSIGHFVRLGVQEVTRKGMNEDNMKTIAHIISSVLNGTAQDGVARQLAIDYQSVHYSFDAILEETERTENDHASKRP
jgi:fluorothreonine transaldolase